MSYNYSVFKKLEENLSVQNGMPVFLDKGGKVETGAQFLRRYIKNKNISNREFATNAGVDESIISKILNAPVDKPYTPGVKTIFAIGEHMRLTETGLVALIGRFNNLTYNHY